MANNKIAARHQNDPRPKLKVKIKKDDTVKVIAGRDKGKTGQAWGRGPRKRKGAGRRREHD